MSSWKPADKKEDVRMYPTPPLAWGCTASPPLTSHGWPRGCAGAAKLGDELFLEAVLSVGDSFTGNKEGCMLLDVWGRPQTHPLLPPRKDPTVNDCSLSRGNCFNLYCVVY